MPDVVLRTTFIVGFPGEREEDFETLMAFTREQRFDSVGCFPYSDEDGTTAARMPHKVDAETITARHHAFMTQQKRLHRQRLGRWLEQELTVLVDRQLDFDRFACRHFGQASEVDGVTLVRGEGLQVGSWARVRVTARRGYDLHAEPLALGLRSGFTSDQAPEPA
jgi:ribosomal protein S12 methylthiotransferase